MYDISRITTDRLITEIQKRGFKVIHQQTWENDQEWREAREMEEQIKRELEYGQS